MLFVAISLYFLSLLTQVSTAFFAFLLAKRASLHYRWGWIFLGIGLFLMIGRRVSPILSIIETHRYNLTDAILSLPISLCLLIGVFGIHKLMTKINAGNELLTALSQTDPLTKCLSRTEILFRLSNEIKRAERGNHVFSIFEIDIDHFKNVNDDYGHDVGDEILCSLVHNINTQLRSNDHLGRIGGEEFIVLLPDTDESAARSSAERIRAHIEQHVHYSIIKNQPIRITISIGVTSVKKLPPMCNTSEILAMALKRSDEAMYAAKNNGRNQVRYLDFLN